MNSNIRKKIDEAYENKYQSAELLIRPYPPFEISEAVARISIFLKDNTGDDFIEVFDTAAAASEIWLAITRYYQKSSISIVSSIEIENLVIPIETVDHIEVYFFDGRDFKSPTKEEYKRWVNAMPPSIRGEHVWRDL
jgi:hypothetical protein